MKMEEVIRAGADWLTLAQTKDESQAREANSLGYTYRSMIGAIRNEYSSSMRKWSYYGIHWHSMQAAIALLCAHRLIGEQKYYEAAVRAGEFLLAQQVVEGEDAGLIVTEGRQGDDMIHSVAALSESLPGLYYLYKATGQERWKEALIGASGWISRKSYIDDEGRYRDIYDYRSGKFIVDENIVGASPIRPLIDEGGMLMAYKVSGDERFLEVFLGLAERLLSEEEPAGNWIGYTPNSKSKGFIHARHAWWWGYPMADAFEQTKDERFFDCFERACDWYVWAQNIDGGMHYSTYIDRNKPSFGLCSSAVGCALIMWRRYKDMTGEDRYAEAVEKGIDYLLRVQLLNVEDENLRGAFFESIGPNENSDRIEIYLRDLATIFAIRGLSCWVNSG